MLWGIGRRKTSKLCRVSQARLLEKAARNFHELLTGIRENWKIAAEMRILDTPPNSSFLRKKSMDDMPFFNGKPAPSAHGAISQKAECSSFYCAGNWKPSVSPRQHYNLNLLKIKGESHERTNTQSLKGVAASCTGVVISIEIVHKGAKLLPKGKDEWVSGVGRCPPVVGNISKWSAQWLTSTAFSGVRTGILRGDQSEREILMKLLSSVRILK